MSSVENGEGPDQGALLPNIIDQEVLHQERLSSVVKLVNVAIDAYGSTCLTALRRMVRAGEGKEEIKLAAEKDYKLGDVEIAIDPIGENFLFEKIEELQIPASLHGEHQTFKSPTGETLIHFEIDPFDNTSEYAAGLDTNPWSVLSAYFPNGEPVASLIGNIKENKAFMLKNGEIFAKDFDSGTIKNIRKSERTSLFEEESVLVSYQGSSEYSTPFQREFGDFLEKRPSKALFNGGGGAFIYGPLASGVVDAYVMFDEPYEEIDPGAAIAIVAGCTIGSYDSETDQWIEYAYNPNRKEKTAPGIFIASATPEIRDELISHYRSKRISATSSKN